MRNTGLYIGIILLVVIGGILYLVLPQPKPITEANAGTSSTPNTASSGHGSASLPMVTTDGFASVSSTTAVVVGTIIPGPDGATYWFEYGTTLSFGSTTDVTTAAPGPRTIGTGGYIQNLAPNTEYYFRIGAHNAAGTVYGGPYKFITEAR
jgi:hypothetical protein